MVRYGNIDIPRFYAIINDPAGSNNLKTTESKGRRMRSFACRIGIFGVVVGLVSLGVGVARKLQESPDIPRIQSVTVTEMPATIRSGQVAYVCIEIRPIAAHPTVDYFDGAGMRGTILTQIDGPAAEVNTASVVKGKVKDHRRKLDGGGHCFLYQAPFVAHAFTDFIEVIAYNAIAQKPPVFKSIPIHVLL